MVARVYSPPCPWDTHYQFSNKTLLSKKDMGKDKERRWGKEGGGAKPAAMIKQHPWDTHYHFQSKNLLSNTPT